MIEFAIMNEELDIVALMMEKFRPNIVILH